MWEESNVTLLFSRETMAAVLCDYGGRGREHNSCLSSALTEGCDRNGKERKTNEHNTR